MRKDNWGSMSELELDAMLEHSISDLPPEDIVAQVTPWRRAMHRVLLGLALNAITLQFWNLQYLLPAIGMLLLLLGFRALRQENRWFRACFVITAVRAAYLFPLLVLNTTILHGAVYGSAAGSVLTVGNLALQLAQFVCFWRGLRAVQRKAGLPSRSGGAVALIVWYVLVCLLALVQYNGLVIAGAMIVGYGFIIRSLCKLSSVLDEAGYAIQPAQVRVSDRALVATIVALVLVGCVCGYLFGGSYPMDWRTVDPAEHDEVAEIRTQLLDLGFPRYVLNDLSAGDIAACAGALQVISDVHDHPVNEGRYVVTTDPVGGFTRHERVYDVYELRITGVAVQLPGEREQWMLFHHFLWIRDPGFYGTESIQLWPAYRAGNGGWAAAGDVTGRVLYDRDGVTFAAPYYSLGEQTYASNNLFWGEQTSTDVFAAFSMPRDGERHRGYLAYPIVELQDGYITDGWINYTHQTTWAQYPAETATEHRIKNNWLDDRAFHLVQDALQFYSSDEGVRLLS